MENVFENIKNVSENAAEKVENAVENVEKAVENAENAVENVVENVVERNEGVLFCAPVGRLDTVSSAALKEQIDAVGTEDADIELDFANVAYISSAGLRILLMAQKIMNKQGSMVVKNASAEIKEIFEVTGFCDILTIE